MTASHLLKRLLLAGAAAGVAACGARTGEDLDEPHELLGPDTGTAGRAGSAQGGSSQAGAAQAGKAGANAGSAGAAGKPIVTGCFDGATCVAGSWCSPTKDTSSVCACSASGVETCGKAFPWGQTTKVCFELGTPDLPCPASTDPSLYQKLPWELGCTGISSGPDFHYVGGSVQHPACCYDVGNFGCGGRPLVVSSLGWTAGLVVREDWV